MVRLRILYPPTLYKDRTEAGQKLGLELQGLELENAVVLAIPAGGVPVGAELARILGISDLDENQYVYKWNKKRQIIGIVDNMQYESLKEPIKPTIYTIENWGRINILVKIHGSKIKEFTNDIPQIWKSTEPEWPLEYSFLDQNLDRVYKSETRALNLFMAFTAIAIFLSCMGIYGLAANSVNKRIKEVGIRKVFGANILDILKTPTFTKLAQFARLIPKSAICTYYFLQKHACRIIFMLASKKSIKRRIS